jgi:hypothetical protein
METFYSRITHKFNKLYRTLDLYHKPGRLSLKKWAYMIEFKGVRARPLSTDKPGTWSRDQGRDINPTQPPLWKGRKFESPSFLRRGLGVVDNLFPIS